VHFNKTYAVLADVLAAHPAAFANVKSFLDLGCAPGGFASRMLEEIPEAKGYGVTLPVEKGGFPVLLIHERLQVQGSNLMELESPAALECPDGVDVCLADAQDLGRRTRPESNGGRKGGKRGAASTNGTPSDKPSAEAGVQSVVTVLGSWALTLQELMLGFGRLRAGGTFVFRFGWRGRGDKEEPWYRDATTRLFALILAHFDSVLPFKSEFSHQADASFYVVARGFRRDAYVSSELEEKLREAVGAIRVCERVKDMPGCMEAMAEYATEDMSRRIDELLESIGRLRAIGIATRQHLEGGRAGPEAALFISPVPFNLTMQRLRARLERYGKIAYMRRRAHPIGVGADAVVQFTQPSHAAAALEAILQTRLLGDNISASRLCDVQGGAAAG